MLFTNPCGLKFHNSWLERLTKWEKLFLWCNLILALLQLFYFAIYNYFIVRCFNFEIYFATLDIRQFQSIHLVYFCHVSYSLLWDVVPRCAAPQLSTPTDCCSRPQKSKQFPTLNCRWLSFLADPSSKQNCRVLGKIKIQTILA